MFFSNSSSFYRCWWNEFMGRTRKATSAFVVLNDKGLHTRPSAEIAKCAAGFSARVFLSYRNYTVSAKSLLGILTMAAERGAKIGVEAFGEDAEQAVDALVLLARNRFNVKY